MKKLILISLIFFINIGLGFSQTESTNEHLKFQTISADTLLVRNAYVCNYNQDYRVPNWVAYHITPDYFVRPKRKGKLKNFSADPDVTNAVKHSDYTGMFAEKGYARGHLAPFFISGGDRDKDGVYAIYDSEESDVDDEQTCIEVNYMSNIAPQHHSCFNGQGGLWYDLETFNRETVVEENQNDVWVMAGCIINNPNDYETIGPDSNIAVPDFFWKILILENENPLEEPYVLAFFFPHFKYADQYKDTDIFDYLVSIDLIERYTGLNLFDTYSEEVQIRFESQANTDGWEDLIISFQD